MMSDIDPVRTRICSVYSNVKTDDLRKQCARLSLVDKAEYSKKDYVAYLNMWHMDAPQELRPKLLEICRHLLSERAPLGGFRDAAHSRGLPTDSTRDALLTRIFAYEIEKFHSNRAQHENSITTPASQTPKGAAGNAGPAPEAPAQDQPSPSRRSFMGVIDAVKGMKKNLPSIPISTLHYGTQQRDPDAVYSASPKSRQGSETSAMDVDSSARPPSDQEAMASVDLGQSQHATTAQGQRGAGMSLTDRQATLLKEALVSLTKLTQELFPQHVGTATPAGTIEELLRSNTGMGTMYLDLEAKEAEVAKARSEVERAEVELSNKFAAFQGAMEAYKQHKYELKKSQAALDVAWEGIKKHGKGFHDGIQRVFGSAHATTLA